MKTCSKCNKELKDAAKFCSGCGYKFPEEPASTAAGSTCPQCGNQLKPGAKFCGKCGAKLDASAAQDSDAKSLERVGDSGYIRWTMLPGQVAVKITEDEIDACGKIKGVVIQDGIKALVFVNGKLAAELNAGSYEFGDFGTVENSVDAPTRTGGLLGFLKDKCHRAWEAIVGSPTKAAISIVLVRSIEFPLVFNFKGANTSGVRSDVGLHMLCKISNVNAFYQSLLLDQKFISFDVLRTALEMVVGNQVNLAVASLSPERVNSNPQLNATLRDKLQTAINGVYPFIGVSAIIQVTADNQAVENLRKMGEELYVSEQELLQLQKRNDFLNRLQATKNEQELTEGKQGADFAAKKLEIYKQMELTKDEQEKFDLMLSAEKQLREAKSQEQIDAAMHEYEKSGMLREQEIDQLRHKGRMADLRNTQEYDMAELKGELAMKREQDAYSDERRRAEMQLDKEDQQNQIDMLRQAQAIRQEREDAEHRRQMETEKQKIDAKLENQRIYAGMTVEQIMASNPDLSPEAAKALAVKFGSEAKDELLKAREADMARQNAQQMEMMKMMQQMAMAGMGVNQQHQQEMMAAKQAELNRTREDANRQEDRILAGVQSAVSAAGAAFSGKVQSSGNRSTGKEGDVPTPSAGQKGASASKCPKCGADIEPGSSFCGECGETL